MRDHYRLVSAFVFGVVAVLQAVRIFNQWPVQVGPITVPLGFSWVAVVGAGGLCAWALRSRR